MKGAVSNKVNSGTDGYERLRLDPSTLSVHVIEYEHHEIHSGSFFRAGAQKDVPNGGTSILGITTPNSAKRMHFRPSVDVEVEAQIRLVENPDSMTGGTAMTPRNANRNSDNESDATVVVDPTVTIGAGILLANIVLGSAKSSGGNANASFEWVLKENTNYALIVTNQASGANETNIRCAWYEHTDKY